jgi:hypothetical protein
MFSPWRFPFKKLCEGYQKAFAVQCIGSCPAFSALRRDTRACVYRELLQSVSLRMELVDPLFEVPADAAKAHGYSSGHQRI